MRNIADIHRDLTPDADERPEAFMKKVDEGKPDFLMSLGDFAHPFHILCGLPAKPLLQMFRCKNIEGCQKRKYETFFHILINTFSKQFHRRGYLFSLEKSNFRGLLRLFREFS